MPHLQPFTIHTTHKTHCLLFSWSPPSLRPCTMMLHYWQCWFCRLYLLFHLASWLFVFWSQSNTWLPTTPSVCVCKHQACVCFGLFCCRISQAAYFTVADITVLQISQCRHWGQRQAAMCLFFAFCLVVVCTCAHRDSLIFPSTGVLWFGCGPVAPPSVEGQLLLSMAMCVLAHGQTALFHVNCRVGRCCLCFDFIASAGAGQGVDTWTVLGATHTNTCSCAGRPHAGNLIDAKRLKGCRMCSLVQSPVECHDIIPCDKFQLGWPCSSLQQRVWLYLLGLKRSLCVRWVLLPHMFFCSMAGAVFGVCVMYLPTQGDLRLLVFGQTCNSTPHHTTHQHVLRVWAVMLPPDSVCSTPLTHRTSSQHQGVFLSAVLIC